MITSTLPRFDGDEQANFVAEQANAWATARPSDQLAILAPSDPRVAERGVLGPFAVERFNYFWPRTAQALAYPAILPNLRRNSLLWTQVPFFLLAEYRAARRIIKSGIDLVYAHWVAPQGVVAWWLKRTLGIPYVLQNHSSDLAVLTKAGSVGRELARAILRESAHFFCVNSRQSDAALALFRGEDRERFSRKCTVLPMGIAEDGRAGKSAGSRFDIATIGRLSRKKGIDLLILAAELLASRGITPRIGIAGDGEERLRLEALVKRADITFCGFVTGSQKDEFLASSERFAFPALAADGDVEGLPVALLEALARAAPVLASRDSNIELLPEWDALRDHVVFVEDPSDIEALAAALQRLLSAQPHPQVAASVARYRWSNLIGEYLTAIDNSLDQDGFSATRR